MSSVLRELSGSVPRTGELLASRYRAGEVLGEGGMGIVIAATHVHLRERVAVKLLRPGAARTRRSIARFVREARAASRMRSEHTVRVFDVGSLDDGTPYIVMEYLAGSDLAAVLRNSGPLPIQVAVDYVLQACEAIAEAHTLGIVHRDLKPANLFLTRRVDGSPCVKVLDFGVSKVSSPGEQVDVSDDSATLDTDESRHDESEQAGPQTASLLSAAATTLGVGGLTTGVTNSRTLIGSPRYMSPEQITCARDVDARTDLWALGTILFELLAGRTPFSASSFADWREAVLHRSPTPLRAVRAEMPSELEAILLRCLAKQPAHRFASVREFAAAIAKFGPENAKASAERVANVTRYSGSSDSIAPHASQVVPEVRRVRRLAAWVAIGVGCATTVAWALVRDRSAAPSIAPSTSAPPTGATSVRTPEVIEPDVPSAAVVVHDVTSAAPRAGLDSAGPRSTPSRPKLAASVRNAASPVLPSAAPSTSTAPAPSTAPSARKLHLDAADLFNDRE